MGGCGPYRWTEVVVATILGLLAAVTAVIGSVSFFQCTINAWLDYWLIFHGVITLGALMGLMIWRVAPIPGLYINGLTYLLGFLIFLNLGWLLLGNVAVGLVYAICHAGVTPAVYLGIPIDCSSRIVPLTLSVVVIFDVFYVILLAMLCAQTFHWPPVPKEDDTISYPNRWWMMVGMVLGMFTLSVVAIAIGATYFEDCATDDWGAIWLIVFGAAEIVVVVINVYWLRYSPDALKVWSSPTCYLMLPFCVLELLHLAITAVGYRLLFIMREDSCSEIPACNDVLQVTEIVIASIFLLIALVVTYYGLIFLLVALFFFAVTIYFYCSGDFEADMYDSRPMQSKQNV